MSEGTVWIKRGREKPLRQRHPWVFSGAIDHVKYATPGETVVVRGYDNAFLGRGYFNPQSQIQVRMLTWAEGERVDGAFWRQRISAAWERRGDAIRATSDAWRVVHAENDRLPGLVVDRYGPWLVVQVLTLGVERALPEVVAALVEVARPRGILERSDVAIRHHEGLSERVQVLWGESPPAEVTINESSYQLTVDLWHGQKTGFYLDQRLNRGRVAAWAVGRTVLNAFSYSGGFAVHALGAGAAHVTNADMSADALALAERNLQQNGFSPEQFDDEQANVFQLLRDYRQLGRHFDMIILDPPKFATGKKTLKRATRGYKDINLLALQLLRPKGILATFSCSGLVSPDLFQKVVFGASVDAGVEAQIVEGLGQPPDHPVLLSFPEGRYLKGLILQRL